MQFESDPKRLTIPRDKYLTLLQKLNKEGLFGKIAIYPASGVDCLIALFVEKVIGLNWMPYGLDDIVENISPIFSAELISELKSRIKDNLIITSRIDVSRFDLVQKELEQYRFMTPKSLVLKGIYEYVFLLEWDSDTERFYNVSPEDADARAKDWVKEIVSWLNIGDTIVAFDRHLFSFLAKQDALKEINVDIEDFGEDADSVYSRGGVPIIFLPHFARVFKKQNVELKDEECIQALSKKLTC